MTYFDNYKKRMLAGGSNQSDSLKQATHQLINNSFYDSPSYKQVTINGTLIDSQLLHDDNSNKKSILFLPNAVFAIGTVVDIDSSNWLMIDFVNNGITPKGEIRYCNSIFPVVSETKTQIGTDEFGRPVYDTSTTVIDIPCIVENQIYNYEDGNKSINLPENRITVTIKYTSHKDIDINKEFDVFGDSYKITTIDKTRSNLANRTGILTIHAERVVSNT